VEDVLFGVGLVEVVVLLVVFFVGFFEVVVGGIVDAVLFFEVVHILLFVDVAGAGDLVDGHLADHGAEVGGAFEGLFFFEVVHLFNGAGVERGVVVLLVKGLLYEGAGSGDEGCDGGFGGDVASGVEGGDLMLGGGLGGAGLGDDGLGGGGRG
jgi:hypothetical protein